MLLGVDKGINNTLYFPHIGEWNWCYGYKLASPDSSDPSKSCTINMGPHGGASIAPVPSLGTRAGAIRPVVCIPSALLSYNTATLSWDINV